MGRYSINVDEINKMIALLNHVIQKHEGIAKLVNGAYADLESQKGDLQIKLIRDKIKFSGMAFDKQWEHIELLKEFLECLVSENEAAVTTAKNAMNVDSLMIALKEAFAASGGTGRGAIDSTNMKVIGDGNYPIPEYCWNGNDYSNYRMVDGLDYSYFHKQTEYDFMTESGKNYGCCVTSEALIKAIRDGSYTAPKRSDVDGSLNSYHYGMQDLNRAKSAEEQCATIGSYVNNGQPVLFHYNNGAHWVAAVGIRDGADMSNLTYADILVFDPSDAMLKSADQVYNGSVKMNPSTSGRMMVAG